MSEQNVNDTISFDLPKNQSSVIKVIGVGGGGSNAVNHMFGMGIRGVDFVICNTDSQALENSPVPNKIQLGVTLTEGLGAGANPEVGQQAALENIEEIKSVLEHSTKMVFITAGMGGGTGTGAAPVIARAAKECGILTVGIVTIPFIFEGNNRKLQAEKGVDALRKNVDSLIVINNNKLREVYGNLGFKAGFAKADEVLATAARGIAEVITHHYTTNIDLRDAKTVLADSGTAIMGSGSASGENRASGAIQKALDSPLLNDNHIRGAKNVLLLIVSGKEEITIDEIGEINDHIQNEAGGSANIIMGIGEDEDLGNDISVTIVATGFAADQQVQVIGREPQKVVHTLEDEQPVSTPVYNKPLPQNDEDDSEDLINRELARARKAEKKNKPQPNLFEMEDEEPGPEAKTTEEETVVPEAPVSQPEPHEQVFSEVRPEETEEVREEWEAEKEPEEEIVQEEDIRHTLGVDDMDEEDDKVFEIDSFSDEDEKAEFTFEIKEEKQEEEPEQSYKEEQEPEAKQKEEKPQPRQQDNVIRYSLEDYRALEEKLKNAKPKQQSQSSENYTKIRNEEPEDEDLKFVVKKVDKPGSEESEKRSSDLSPMESTIEESMRLKAEERGAKLRAFNYRFKNHPYSVDEAAHEPAYKRQGVKIEESRYSSESRTGRFTIDSDSEGTDIKTNNSFLHDNVD